MMLLVLAGCATVETTACFIYDGELVGIEPCSTDENTEVTSTGSFVQDGEFSSWSFELRDHVFHVRATNDALDDAVDGQIVDHGDGVEVTLDGGEVNNGFLGTDTVFENAAPFSFVGFDDDEVWWSVRGKSHFP